VNSRSTDANSNRRILLLLALAAFLWTALRSWGYRSTTLSLAHASRAT
jgi:hypothetical protein